MPRYVEEQFVEACAEVGLKIEPRADGLWRIEHVLADLRSDRLESVRRLGKPETTYRKVTFHKAHLDEDQHLDAVLLGPGHPLYAAVDERLNEKLALLIGGMALYVDTSAQAAYRLHFFEISVRGQNTKGENLTLYAELVALRENLTFPLILREGGDGESRFTIVPADCLLDLPVFPNPPESIPRLDATAGADFLKSTYQSERRQACQDERKQFVQVCREYLEKSFSARLRAAQDRVMSLRAREALPAPACSGRQAGGSPDLPAPREGLFFVYAVECEDGSYYIGQTEDLRRRWDEHQKGQGADWTRSHKALRIVHFEEFDSREAAVQREKDLKTGFGRKWLKEQIQSGRARQAGVAVARQRAENDLADLQRTQKERMAGLDRLAIARHVRALPFQDPLRIRSRPAQDSRGIHKLFAGRPTRALSAHYPLTIRSGPA